MNRPNNQLSLALFALGLTLLLLAAIAKLLNETGPAYLLFAIGFFAAGTGLLAAFDYSRKMREYIRSIRESHK